MVDPIDPRSIPDRSRCDRDHANVEPITSRTASHSHRSAPCYRPLCMPLRRASSRLAIASIVGSLLPLSACPADDVNDIDASPSCIEAREHADLDWIQAKVFTPSCAAFTACHQGAASQAGGLDLDAGRSHDSLVNVPSSRFPEWTLVVPNQPAMSYLMVVLGQYPGPLDEDIGTMPYNTPLLCKEKRDAIERWILAGAPDSLDAGVDAPIDAPIDAPVDAPPDA
jgi:hypothetical protein